MKFCLYLAALFTKFSSCMKLLLLSNSTNSGEEYLSWGQEEIKAFLGEKPVTALFIPYAAVTFGFDEYESKVEARFSQLGHHITSIHHAPNPIQAVEQAEAIVVGGGNTWQLVHMMHEKGLMEPIRQKVEAGTPYIGWSAGSNVTCPTLRTTNDMPIIDPLGFDTLNLIPFQINPHYLDANPEGFGGETREMRIREFIEINPDIYVLGLREATLLKLEGESLKLIGSRTARLFKKGQEPQELGCGDDLSFLVIGNFLQSPYDLKTTV
jgi:dipeptidase E